MRAILIDPRAKIITEVECTGEGKDIYRLIECDTFTTVRVDERHHMFVDDNGLYVPNQCYFAWGTQEHLAGKGLVLGMTENGEEAPCTLRMSTVVMDVGFYVKQPIFSHLSHKEEPNVEILPGVKGFKITRTPHFK